MGAGSSVGPVGIPLGSTELVKVDVRILAATNADLRKLVEDGRFRAESARDLVLGSRHYGLLREAHSPAF